MEIAAIVLNYFGAVNTLECIASLLDADILSGIVVVENSCSADEQRRIEHGVGQNGLVRILSPGRNLGFAGGVNYALRTVGIDTYDGFLILNNDTLIPPGTVSLLEQGLVTGGLGFVAPVIYEYPETDSIWSNGNYYNRFTGLVFQYTVPLPFNFYYLTGCCLLVGSGVFERIGLFDESFFMYGEDVEYCFRAARLGVKYGVVPEARIFHKGSRSSGNNSLFYEYHINRGHLLLGDKLARSSKEARLSLALKLIMLSVRAFWRALRYGNGNSLRGLRMAITEILGNEAGVKNTL